MAAFGFSPAAVAEMQATARQAHADEGLAVHPDNVTAVRWFLAMQTQWRVVSLSTLERAEIRRTGLDYAVAEVTARLKGLEPSADAFARLQLLEAEALTAWAEESRR